MNRRQTYSYAVLAVLLLILFLLPELVSNIYWIHVFILILITTLMTASLRIFTASAEVAKPRKITYRVRRGDSLSRISHRFRVTVRQLRRWNGIKGNKYLQPGQELTLYVALTADSERG